MPPLTSPHLLHLAFQKDQKRRPNVRRSVHGHDMGPCHDVPHDGNGRPKTNLHLRSSLHLQHRKPHQRLQKRPQPAAHARRLYSRTAKI